jgi:hypothetical protein
MQGHGWIKDGNELDKSVWEKALHGRIANPDKRRLTFGGIRKYVAQGRAAGRR